MLRQKQVMLIHCLFFLILDAATNLLWAHAQDTYDADETIQSLRNWCDEIHCKPKTLVGDMAFFSPTFLTYYKAHNIKTMPTGPRTPWPNRAETAVRLFKRQLRLLRNEQSQIPALTTVTYQNLDKATVWARNNQMMISGRNPIELAFGRRPPDLRDCEPRGTDERSTYQGQA